MVPYAHQYERRVVNCLVTHIRPAYFPFSTQRLKLVGFWDGNFLFGTAHNIHFPWGWRNAAICLPLNIWRHPGHNSGGFIDPFIKLASENQETERQTDSGVFRVASATKKRAKLGNILQTSPILRVLG